MMCLIVSRHDNFTSSITDQCESSWPAAEASAIKLCMVSSSIGSFNISMNSSWLLLINWIKAGWVLATSCIVPCVFNVNEGEQKNKYPTYISLSDITFGWRTQDMPAFQLMGPMSCRLDNSPRRQKHIDFLSEINTISKAVLNKCIALKDWISISIGWNYYGIIQFEEKWLYHESILLPAWYFHLHDYSLHETLLHIHQTKIML